MSALACLRSSITIVPFFESLGPGVISFMLNQTEMPTVCLDTNKKLEIIMKLKREGKIEKVKNVISYDKINEEAVKEAESLGVKVRWFWDLVEEGKTIKEGEEIDGQRLEEPKPETIYMFCYTSGTTGDPKGTMLSHKNMISCCHLADHFQVGFSEDDVAISYLPYGHTFEQCIFVFSLLRGFSHGYYSGDPLKLIEDIQILRPTIFCTVPRILNRIYSKIHESLQTKSAMVQWLFNKAVESKKYYFERDGTFHYKLYDQLVFNKIK
jgi:long-chain acyl-CoA synthetase